ncbi:small integral membrane protein 12-like [Procambarus clarkii]|uniref:small integral membrane protein 12-like n=1 Tax=Procambarus clarkii TaxID=6728 RepID=UPI001E679043|nr:small integral membrane protein 12-like [Procambarus clarkii]XP_045595359.1 small integral membrane protein 12-like [Procambarus clarkii]
MWPLVMTFMRTYAPYVTLPAAAVIGFIGYNIEKQFRTPPPSRPSVEETRHERLLKEMMASNELALAPLSEKTFVPKTIFEKNVSPSLVKED